MRDTDGIDWNIRPTINGKEMPNLYHLFGVMRDHYLANGHDQVAARRLALDHLREVSKPEPARPNRHDR